MSDDDHSNAPASARLFAPVLAPALTPVLAPAKINLFLHITGRRPDGLHLLQSIFAYASVGDCLSIAPAPRTSLDISGPCAAELKAQGAGNRDNIIFRAAERLQAMAGRELPAFDIQLQKNLPVAAGIGGGSADAAAALRMLCDFWGLDLDREKLMELALSLGADVPACLDGRAAWVDGVGENITPLADFPTLSCVLINPMEEVSTAAVFKRFADSGQSFSAPLQPWQGQGPTALLKFLADTGNDLEQAALSIAPVVAEVIDVLSAQVGCGLARMSGSGATCFGLFGDASGAELAAVNLKDAHPDWWIMSATLGNSVSDKALDF